MSDVRLPIPIGNSVVKKSLYPLVFMCVVLSSCMTTSPKDYKALSSTSYFVLEQDVMVQTKIAAGLAKGTYRSIFESSESIYYLGESKALILNPKTRVNGGIAISKHASNPVCHLFIQIGDDSEEVRSMGMGPVVSQLAKLEAGRIREFKNDPSCQPLLPYAHVVKD